ncbi:MAG TPA: GNAT family protein [bacterium]|nr:GNAT family protein [bacterium]HQO35203.1 GNAT family protein [bacterium]HQQ00564.1 GNAT family protein [bacterium]
MRTFQRSDCDKMAAWKPHDDPLYAPYTVPNRTVAEWNEWFEQRVAAPDVFAYAIDSPNGDLVGWMVLSSLYPQGNSAQLGIDLNPAYLYQGIGCDAIRTLLSVLFNEWGFQKMRLEVCASNLPAIRCYEKCGFQITGRKWGSEEYLSKELVFQDHRFDNVRRYYRLRDNTLETLYYDMTATSQSVQEMRREI